MSEYTLTNATGTESVWVSRNERGEIVKERIERNLYIVPPMGVYRLRVLRFAEPFDMPKAEQFGGGMQRMTRLELQIIGGKGNGKRVAPMMSLSLGKKAILGQIIRACEGRDLNPGEEYSLFNLTGKEFQATLRPSDSLDEAGKPKYCRIVDGTIAPVTDDDEGLWAEAS
jgi:hypothetical protein